MRNLFLLILKYRRRVLLGVFFLLIVDASHMVLPWVLKFVIDDLSSLPLSHSLIFYISIIIALGLAVIILRYLWRVFIIGASRMVERDIRNDFYHRLMSLGARFYNKIEPGDIMARATNDVSAVQEACGFGVVIAADIVFMGLFSILMMTYISKPLTLYTLTISPFVVISTYFFGKKIHIKFEKTQEGFSFLSGKAREFIMGILTIKSYVQEKEAIADFNKVNKDYLEKNVELIRYWTAFRPTIFFLTSIGFLIVLYLGGKDVISGRITLGSFVAFLYYLDLLVWPMIAIGMVVNIIERGTASLKRLNEILNLTPEIKDKGEKEIEKGLIELKNVYFSYDGVPVLKGINIKFEPNKKTAIVGPTGSGKSTIINLLWREFESQGIYIDGKPIQDFSLQKLRSSIGLVPQTPILFSATIRENIAFGIPSAKEEEIINAAKNAEIYNEIMELPMKFDTILGEKGASLSGGQKQRIAIARALILNPKILILDDALSSVDSRTEKRIMENIAEFLKSRTSIVISHRISAVIDADEIIVLDKGVVVERGTHKELTKNKGLYARLYEKQKLEELLE
ncbi:MAG: ABC transporter ATP-binding protein [candidate division WOR-3 bacterium]